MEKKRKEEEGGGKVYQRAEGRALRRGWEEGSKGCEKI